MGGAVKAILKGIGATIQEIDKTAGVALDGVAAKVTDKVIEGTPKVVKGMFKPVSSGNVLNRIKDEKAGSLLQRVAGTKMKVGAGVGIAGLLTVGGVADEGIKTNTVTSMGEISVGELAGTVNFTRSPNLNAAVDAMDADERNLRQFQKNQLNTNNYGAEGDIVFALHNLRKG